MTAYATRGDVYRFGLARGSLGNQGRAVQSSLASTDTLELIEHGFETGDAVTVRALEGGSLSVPLVSGTTYYAIRLSGSEFQLSSAPTGSPIDLTTDGSLTFVANDLPFDDVLEFYSRFVDGFLPAHLVPLTSPYPIIVVAIVAELSAKKLQLISGVSSDSMKETELGAMAQLQRWSAGLPLRDVNATLPANLAVTSTFASTRDPRGWGSGRLP